MKYVKAETNRCVYRNEAEGVCEKNGQVCPLFFTDHTDLACGGCMYEETDEEE